VIDGAEDPSRFEDHAKRFAARGNVKARSVRLALPLGKRYFAHSFDASQSCQTCPRLRLALRRGFCLGRDREGTRNYLARDLRGRYACRAATGVLGGAHFNLCGRATAAMWRYRFRERLAGAAIAAAQADQALP
jgi:hypothetical protein